MSPRAQAILGFGIAGAVLLGLADVAPKLALGMAGIIGLGVALAHGSDLQYMVQGYLNALGQGGSAGGHNPTHQ